MDNYEYNDSPAQKQGSRIELWDILSIFVLLITLCMGVYFVLVFIFPTSAINPRPPSDFNLNAPPTPTITAIQLEPTWTATPFSATQTPTLFPTLTVVPSATPFSLLPPTETPTFTPTPKAPFSATVSFLQADIIPHLQGVGCDWQGVAGSVVDANNADIIGLAVRLAGTLNGKSIGTNGSITTVSGTSTDYGRSGFEFKLGTTPISSDGTLYLQLLDTSGVQAGLPLSDNVYIDTYKDCEKNLVIVRFKKNR